MPENESFEGWAILELMGHRKLAGWIRAEEIGGASFIRIDVPGDKSAVVVTQYYAPAAVYCITPTTEPMALRFAARHRPEPVARYELEYVPPGDSTAKDKPAFSIKLGADHSDIDFSEHDEEW